MAERVGFEPTCPLLAGKTLSRRPRYDHFGTSPRIRFIDSLAHWLNESILDAPSTEELADQTRAILFQDATHDFHPMICFGVVEDV